MSEDHEWRIWLDDRAQLYAVVDEDDWHYFSQWLWCPKISRGGWKVYARRNIGRADWSQSVYLHIEILKLKAPEPPTPLHTLADHINGDSLMCRRENLQWATPSMNRRSAIIRPNRQRALLSVPTLP